MSRNGLQGHQSGATLQSMESPSAELIYHDAWSQVGIGIEVHLQDQDQVTIRLERSGDVLCSCVIIYFGDYEATIPCFSCVGRSEYPAHASTRTTPK